MGKRDKKPKSAKSGREEEDGENSGQEKPSKSVIVLSSDDDDDDDNEANEDLSLKIVEKAKLRVSSAVDGREAAVDKSNGDGVVIDLSASPMEGATLVKCVTSIKKKKKEKKMKNIKKIETQDGADPIEANSSFKEFCGDLFLVDSANEEEKAEAGKDTEISNSAETNAVEKSDNIVLRKLLRGPRYFDPPNSGGWGACYNCGEEGHSAANCTQAKRRKPCFVCGGLDHNAKQCSKGQDCYICKNSGHRAKNCPEKSNGMSQISKECLKCGYTGHDMFSCRSDYSPDDLKDIQCYICKSFGHLCCVDYTESGSREVSCYRCGQSGHTGLACMGSKGEATGSGSHSSCFRCGEEGHFARECASSVKVSKRKREFSTPRKRQSEEDRDDMVVKSAPHNLGKPYKRKNNQYENGRDFATSSPSKSKRKGRGGWITNDPGDFPSPSKGKSGNGWRSPKTPTQWNNRNPNPNFNPKFSGGGYSSTSHSSSWRSGYGNSYSNGGMPQYYHQHRFSASRFGNSSNDGMWRNDHW